jgi:hypothetical protein
MNSVSYKILINVINKEELYILLFVPTNSRLWVLFKKPVHRAVSECDWLQLIMCLYWHTRGQPWAVQQNRHITEFGNTVMVKCQHFRCGIHSNRTTDAGFQRPWQEYQCTALIWNPLRPLYCYQEEVSQHAYEAFIAQQCPSPCGLVCLGHIVLHVLGGVEPCPM